MNVLISRVQPIFTNLIRCLLIFYSGFLWADSELITSQKLRFAVIYVEEPPFIYSHNTAEYQGIVPSLIAALGRELNVEVEYVPISRKGLEAGIIAGRADVTWLSPDWVENKQQLLFSDPVLIHREFLYSLQTFNKDQDVRDWVKDKTICVRQDYRYPRLAPLFKEQLTQAVRVSSQVPLMSLLLKKRCDLLYMNEHRASWMVNRLSAESAVFRSPQQLEQTNLALMFNIKWQPEMAKINHALSKIKDTGEMALIIQNSIHSDIPSATKTIN
jgi:polar amino acid transport system substrate-binding protein